MRFRISDVQWQSSCQPHTKVLSPPSGKETKRPQGLAQRTSQIGQGSRASAATKYRPAPRPANVAPNPPAQLQSPVPRNSGANAAVARPKSSVPPAPPGPEAVHKEPVAKKPVAKKPVAEKPVAEKLAAKKPAAEKPAAEKDDYKNLECNARDADILDKELHKNYPGQLWFDGYDSLGKLSKTPSKSKTTTTLAELPLLVRKNGDVVNLRDAVWDTISYLLGVDAKWNRYTKISSKPQGCTSVLWTGQLWLGGIKDSMDTTGFLKNEEISAIVSVHPKDPLTEKEWPKIFAEWDGEQKLEPGWIQVKLGQDKPAQKKHEQGKLGQCC